MNLGAKPILSRSECRKLVTSPAGFRGWGASLRRETNRRFTPLKSEAIALRFIASRARYAKELTKFREIRPALLTAAGISANAARNLQESDKEEAIHGLIDNFLEPAGANFVEELVFRFLLTRGDTLGGSMRNVGGFMAQCKLTRAIIAHLKMAHKPCRWLHSKNKVWAEIPQDDTDIELHLRGLSWKENSKCRTMIYNLTIPLFGNNVDMCLFDCSAEDLTKETHNSARTYIALGELKGGIDPGGADEHWKTAGSALIRIREGFSKRGHKPKTFFIGAAIQAKMAVEIWDSLKKGVLENAANLTDENQIASITRWLCSL